MPLLRKQFDFLYWHAVSKMRMADFDGAGSIFHLLQSADPSRVDVVLGRIYCLMRRGEHASASEVLAGLRRYPLQPEEMALLGRLQRRCEFELTRQGARQRAAAPLRGEVAAVAMPHTLGDDAMARLAMEHRH